MSIDSSTPKTDEIKFNCTHCQQHISTGIEAAGVEATCPACGGTIVVPGGEPRNGDPLPDESKSSSHHESSRQTKRNSSDKQRGSPKIVVISLAITTLVGAALYFFTSNENDSKSPQRKSQALPAENKEGEDPENPTDPYSQLALGLKYYQGTERPQNYKKAITQFEKSANQGVLFAQYLLGVCCLNGQGVEADPKEARKWILRSAEAGFDLAQEHIGRLYVAGLDGERNFVKAYKWLNIAAANCKDDTKESAIKWRKQVAKLLSQQELQKAQKLSHDWKVKPAYKK